MNLSLTLDRRRRPFPVRPRLSILARHRRRLRLLRRRQRHPLCVPGERMRRLTVQPRMARAARAGYLQLARGRRRRRVRRHDEQSGTPVRLRRGRAAVAPCARRRCGRACTQHPRLVAHGRGRRRLRRLVRLGVSTPSTRPAAAARRNASRCGSARRAGYVDNSPTVANGVVYAGDSDGKLYAFDAAGCGAATCEPIWTGERGQRVLFVHGGGRERRRLHRLVLRRQAQRVRGRRLRRADVRAAVGRQRGHVRRLLSGGGLRARLRRLGRRAS